ncbi:ribosome hibernation-promoting factor, HPF/YfiA family [Lacisediminimonas sp.]|uniref:ribosome hibernation-promoting factor, HPF/YfiA family n=1 Tax=Lacisediminimonas sp. TaxID=3060582 RepID=UPI00271F7C3E|nr:ribosome-associated translation inhibitor RaiA [Lacisediminimonas sp.]MDO8301141.1 ribosome-associated translation inhibitor RaiA [Lacisediminimonas sp.]MDO9217247.1 ribosome-associated translation inhibitor RaiA [Lacisediminimonas sp.]
MNLLITGHHLDLTPAIRQFVEEKVQRITRHFDQVMEIEVVLTLEENADKDKRQRAEVNVRVKGDTLHAESYAQDLYAALDSVVEKLDRQVARHKDKIKDHNNIATKHLQP